jgi:hypothetical protein
MRSLQLTCAQYTSSHPFALLSDYDWWSPLTSGNDNPRRAGLSLLGLLASSQLTGCLMAGNSPSGSDMRWLYAMIVAMVAVVILWLVLRYMR